MANHQKGAETPLGPGMGLPEREGGHAYIRGTQREGFWVQGRGTSGANLWGALVSLLVSDSFLSPENRV